MKDMSRWLLWWKRRSCEALRSSGLGAVLEGDASLEVERVNSLDQARAGELSFLSSERYLTF